MKTRINIILFSLIIMFFSQEALYPVSNSVNSRDDYRFILTRTRNVSVIVENFGTARIKEDFKNIKILFRDAGEDFYAQNFDRSEQKFRKIKRDLIVLLKNLSSMYLERTLEILDSTSEESFDILIKFGKDGALAQYLKKPFDPLSNSKPIDAKDYHYFWDKQKIEAYLKTGYMKYHRAKNIFNDPELAYLENKKNATSKMLDLIITQYSSVISLCREAKQYGIEIHKIHNINELGKSYIKYGIRHGRIIPVFDDRIPEKYKVDANDNLNLIHSIELKKLSSK